MLGLAALGAVAAFVWINALMVGLGQGHIYESVGDIAPHTVAIVPGAAVYQSGKLSPAFLGRAEGAVALYKAGVVRAILVSGDNSTVEHNEVDPAKRYLLTQGIPEEDIYLDHAGFDTYSTMYRARAIFGVTSAVISTQGYHLPRSIFLAQAQGIEAAGYRVDAGNTRVWNNETRESLARIKAVLDVALGRSPKFLGEQVLVQ